MRLLSVAPQPFFTPRGTPLSVYYRSMVTAELGVEVDLLTYGAGHDVDLPGVRIRRIPRLRFLEPIPVGPSAAKLVLDAFMVLWTVALCVRHRYQIVHAHEESVFWCALLQPLLRFRLVYDMHSSLPQQLTNFRFTESRLLIRIFQYLEDLALRRAEAVITICPALADHAEGRMSDPGRHVLIENSIFEPVRLVAPASTASDPGGPDVAIPPGPRVVYAGTFEAYQGVDLLIKAFARAARVREDAVLLLVGGSPRQVEEYRSLAEREGVGLDRCVFTGAVSRERAQSYVAAADVLTSPRLHGTNTPLKVYEQLASGIPLVATRIESHTQVLTDDVAFLADPDPVAFGDALVAALTDRDEGVRRTREAAAQYRERYARPAYEAKLRRALALVGA